MRELQKMTDNINKKEDNQQNLAINVFEYHVSCTDGKISVRIKIGITFIFRLHRHSIQLVMLAPVDLSLTI